MILIKENDWKGIEMIGDNVGVASLSAPWGVSCERKRTRDTRSWGQAGGLEELPAIVP